MPKIDIHDFDEFRTGEVLMAACNVILQDLAKTVPEGEDHTKEIIECATKIRAITLREFGDPPMASDCILYCMSLVQALLALMGFAAISETALKSMAIPKGMKGIANA